MLDSSIRLKEEVSFDGQLLTMPESSSRMIGVVDVDEYDAYGRKIFHTRNMNDITLPGSIFMLEQMFKIEAKNQRFLHPTSKLNYKYDTTETFDARSTEKITTDINLGSQKVFGFMVGIGGTDSGSNVIAPDYNITSLSKFVPFRSSSDEDEIKELKKQYTFAFSNNNTTYFYVKKFDIDPSGNETDSSTESTKNTTKLIRAQWADGSGDVDDSEFALSLTTPIVAYAQCELNVSANDVREYFGDMNLDSCAINQLGLVAGQPVEHKDQDGKLIYTDYTDVKLISCVNFKARDLSNTENTLKITYKIYCL